MRSFLLIMLGVVIVTFIFVRQEKGQMEMVQMEEWTMQKEGKEIKLPLPEKKGELSLEEAIEKRRSIRNYQKRELELGQISQLLWAAGGITDARRGFRSAPSAGALYPLEIYVVNKDGLYHYRPEGHRLIKIGEKDLRLSLCGAALSQQPIAHAPLNIVVTAVYERTTLKYAQRGIRYVHQEAGHVAQNIHLQAVALGLGSVPIGAFNDKEVSNVLNLPSEENPLYIIPVGYPK